MYHLSSKSKTRLKSSSAAVLAYRVGLKLSDPHDHTMKFPHRNIREIQNHFVVNWDSPGRSDGRRETYQTILNEIGRTETRCNSRLWREFEIALPVEGANFQRAKLAEDFATQLAHKYGVCIVVGIHTPPNTDTINHHAHLLATTRCVERTPNGIRLTKKNRELDAWKMLKIVRKLWEECLNGYYRRFEIDKEVSCESNKERGIGKIPTIHEGPNSRQRKGDRWKANETIRKLNKRAPAGATSPSEVFALIPAIQDKLEKDLHNTNAQIALLEHEIVEKLTHEKLSPRQKKQMATWCRHAFETIDSGGSPDDIASKLKEALRRGGVARGAYDRLRKSLPPIGGDIEVQWSRQGIDLMASLFDAPCDEALEKLKRWRKGGTDVTPLALANLEDPALLQQIHDWLTAPDSTVDPDKEIEKP